jgi:hypothetical protein
MDDIIKGFVMLLQFVEDTTLDIVDSELALFVDMAAIDEVLIPLNLDKISNKLCPTTVVVKLSSHHTISQ